MKGNNELLINEATVMEAMQEYLDKRSTDEGRVEVYSVSWSGQRDLFVVKVKQKGAADGE